MSSAAPIKKRRKSNSTNRGKVLKREPDNGNIIIKMMNDLMDRMGPCKLTELEPVLNYRKDNLGEIYHGYRKMPVVQVRLLCEKFGIEDIDKILDIYTSQPPSKKRVPKK